MNTFKPCLKTGEVRLYRRMQCSDPGAVTGRDSKTRPAHRRRK